LIRAGLDDGSEYRHIASTTIPARREFAITQFRTWDRSGVFTYRKAPSSRSALAACRL
jgi:hypothetical protein